jgi:hypothetical protein
MHLRSFPSAIAILTIIENVTEAINKRVNRY